MFKNLIIFLLFIAQCFAFEITDMRGKKVEIKEPLNSVATISDGFVEGVMTHFGVIDKVKVIGSWSMKRDYKYDFETISGEKYSLSGWNTMKYLHPWLDDLPCINSPQGNILNFEELAKANVDLVILRVGDCTVGAGNKENIEKTIKTIESLGINLAVLYAPNYFKKADLSTMKDEIEVLGAIFQKEEKAAKLYEYLNSTEILIKERTKDIKDKRSVLYIGLNTAARKKGGVGTVSGINTPESYIIEGIANAKNAFASKGDRVILSAEQIYALDPDVIVLPTSNGYHPPRELYESPAFEILNELRAIKEKRVYAMPWSPMNCTRRVEYPIDMLIIAKAAYPEKFSDIKVHEFVLKFYKDVYGVSDEEAKNLRSEQILDWTLEYDF
ncbi:MAG: ABC transporter substrate-binding protein [Campylobacter sputorum]|uniref:ABC transporter substrate-binding protein n=1 Tax=Campylobacter sputorum TaxID=206 RepID=UPI000B77A193|nr:ABC transporter substrate-binding protein [Campylobacter sputorum]ASM37672.1 metal ion ABC transporter, periplasmic metal-binding protein [Campylobacter sputorum bv. paraureolyticus LMG 11764]MDY6120204.1 ABC transporter substrate-binding protein [Campylobacter sputorum]